MLVVSSSTAVPARRGSVVTSGRGAASTARPALPHRAPLKEALQRWPPLAPARHTGHHGHRRARCCTPQVTVAAAATPAAEAPSGGGKGKRVLVVGGGVGGLATAGRLARMGFEVEVLEKNGEVGGRCQSRTVGASGGARIDSGPSLLLFPDSYRCAFREMGADLDEMVELRRVEPAAYRVHFPGDDRAAGEPGSLDMLYDAQQMRAQLEAVEAGAGLGYLKWLASARAALDAGMGAFIERDFENLGEFLDLRRLVPLLAVVNPVELLAPHHLQVGAYFKDPRLRAMFTFQDLYVGLSPYSSPGAFSLLAATELTDGVFYPVGGFGTIRDALLSAATSAGATVRCGCEVSEITVEAGRACGVVLAGTGERIEADAIVANPDLPYAYSLLRDADGRGGGGGGDEEEEFDAEAYGRRRSEGEGAREFSAGVVSYNWTVRGDAEGLLHHNVFLGEEWRGTWDRAVSPATLQAHPNFYVHCPSRTDPSAAPEGKSSVMVLLPMANEQERAKEGEGGGGYEALVEAGRKAVLQTMRDAGVDVKEEDIEDEFVYTPPVWRDMYNLTHGAAFGLSHGLDQLAYFRPSPKDGEVEGLYFAGASTRPGNGVPLCLIGSGLTAARVAKDFAMAYP